MRTQHETSQHDHHDRRSHRHHGGHPVIKVLLILLAVGLFIRLLPYLLAAAGITTLVWAFCKCVQTSRQNAQARAEHEAARLRDQQQADLDERRRLESFLLPEDKEWLGTWK